MKRIVSLCVIMLLGTFLSGCSLDIRAKVREGIENAMQSESGIKSDEDYITAEKLEANGELENGEYNGEVEYAEEAENVENGTVNVSFAENKYISVSFYRDRELKDPIDNDSCTINPGDTIYARVDSVTNPYTDCYKFDSIRVVEYSESGEKGNNIGGFEGSDILSFTLSQFYSGTELSFETVGRYEKQHVVLTAFWDNGAGKENVNGKWYINQDPVVNGDNEVDSSSDYTVVFKYDADEFYFVASDPQDVFSNKDGRIEFNKESRIGGIREFEVELYPYVTMSVQDKKSAVTHVYVNGEERDASDISKLKKGDTVEIYTKTDYKITSAFDYDSYTEKDGSYVFKYTADASGERNIELNVEKWEEKTIEIDMDSKNWFFIILGRIQDWFSGNNTAENSPLVIYAGVEAYTLSDLENNKKIKLREDEELRISVNKELLGEDVLVVTVNGETTRFSGTSDFTEKTYEYEDISTIKIEKE